MSSHGFFAATLATVLYLLLVRALRYQRSRHNAHAYPYATPLSLASMTNDDAQKIQAYILELEFPFIADKALQFALFRTYGIPSISRLLVQTKQLSHRDFASKRYADTEVIIAEIVGQAPSSERTASAIARMNYIHGHYQKSGRISNDDMLYTLALFALEPIRWINQYEWRQLTDMERCAFGVFWKSIGDAMDIDYSVLPSSKAQWANGLHWIDEVQAWSQDYETTFMLPHENNKQLADETIAILLYSIPQIAQPFGKQLISTLMDERLRKAMKIATPPRWLQSCVQSILHCRKRVLRYLALPRPYMLRRTFISDPCPRTGRLHKTAYVSEPWYVKRSLWTRFSSQALLDWCSGRPRPGDGADSFKPEGFLHHEVGPSCMAGKGMAEFEKMRDRLQTSGRGGCPMAFGR